MAYKTAITDKIIENCSDYISAVKDKEIKKNAIAFYFLIKKSWIYNG